MFSRALYQRVCHRLIRLNTFVFLERLVWIRIPLRNVWHICYIYSLANHGSVWSEGRTKRITHYNTGNKQLQTNAQTSSTGIIDSLRALVGNCWFAQSTNTGHHSQIMALQTWRISHTNDTVIALQNDMRKHEYTNHLLENTSRKCVCSSRNKSMVVVTYVRCIVFA